MSKPLPLGVQRTSHYRATRDIDIQLTSRLHELQAEAGALLHGRHFTRWPEAVNPAGWLTHALRHQDQDLVCSAPLARRLLLDDLAQATGIHNASYALLPPRTAIKATVSFEETGLVRYHLPIIAPRDPDAALSLVIPGQGECRHWWMPGRGYLFADAGQEVAAWNKTDAVCVLLAVDFLRDRLSPAT